MTASQLQANIDSLVLLEVEIDKIPFSQRGTKILRGVIAGTIAERQAAQFRENRKPAPVTSATTGRRDQVSALPYLIVSDIHGNLEALNAVLADARGSYGEILCLGDLTDYGADSNAIVDWARTNGVRCVRGNHDRAAVDLRVAKEFNPEAEKSAIWAHARLTPENLTFLRALPQGPLHVDCGTGQSCDMVHGSPAHEDEYLHDIQDAERMLPWVDARVTFFGHTHQQGAFVLGPTGTGRASRLQPLLMKKGHYYLVNPGSVGQPRDGDPRAAYALYWPGKRVEFRRVKYNIKKAAGKIRAAGLPPFHAGRLYGGH